MINLKNTRQRFKDMFRHNLCHLHFNKACRNMSLERYLVLFKFIIVLWLTRRYVCIERDLKFRQETKNDDNSQFSFHTTPNIVLVLFLTVWNPFNHISASYYVSETVNLRLAPSTSDFVLHENRISKCLFSSPLKITNYSIRVSCFLLLKQSYLL